MALSQCLRDRGALRSLPVGEKLTAARSYGGRGIPAYYRWRGDHQLRVLSGHLLIALDGSEYYGSTELHCPNCSTRKRGKGEVEYHHSLLAATLVCPGHNHAVPLEPEFIVPQDGHEKQDCESRAMRRWLAAHGARYARLKPVYLGDDLYSRQPTCQAVLGLVRRGLADEDEMRARINRTGLLQFAQRGGEGRMELHGLDRVEHGADLIFAGDPIHREQGLAVGPSVTRRQMPLMRQEGRALHEERRERSQAEVRHGVGRVLTLPPVGDRCAATPHGSD
jgi:hypothetical protein